MKRFFILILLGCLLLTGCTGLAGNDYLAVTPHTEEASAGNVPAEDTATIVTNRTELRGAVLSFIRSWTEEGFLLVRSYEGDIEADLAETIRYAIEEEPIGAYAVDYADAELSGTARQGMIRVRIVFRRSSAEIDSIITVSDNSTAEALILEALENYDPALTLRIRSYDETDHLQMIYSYCLEHPERMVAIPDISAEVYPKEGDTRILELRFDYPVSRDELRRRQTFLTTLLDSAASYVDNGKSDAERLELLHRFLTGRFTYSISAEEPQMPAYSLLYEGTAHSLSFAVVARSQCLAAGIDCLLVRGTRNGSPHYWNIVTLDGVYYHMDLMRAVELSETALNLFAQTDVLTEEGYVWDAALYPANPEPEPTEPTAPPYTEPEPTEYTTEATAPSTEAESSEESTETTAETPVETTEATEEPTEPTP